MPDTTAPEELGLSAAGLGRVDAFVAAYLAECAAPGVLTLVARRGKLAHLACAGPMSLETGRPLTPTTLFRIYSMTKPITCAALLMLVEAGRLGLDDPVARYLPAFATMQVLAPGPAGEAVLQPLARPIRVRDLLTHTAGLGYGLFADAPAEERYRAARLLNRVLTLRVPLAELVAQVAQLPLANHPGEAWRYSFAHDVVAHLVATVAGVPFETFLAERIFGPLGMADTGFAVPEPDMGRLASLYLRGADGALALHDDPASSSYVRPGAQPAGGGGLVSTAGDYLRFAQLLLGGGALDGVRLLQPATVALMTRNHLPAHALPFSIGPDWGWEGYGFGLGVAVLLDPARAGVPGSPGAFEWPGAANTLFWVDPREELVGMLMTQVLPSPMLPPIGRTFRRLVYEAIVGPPGAATTPRPPASNGR
jgi:CubicO group peptidase (beta-lactamase class C family)